jgi:epidermal growth factor receptor substrate 15
MATHSPAELALVQQLFNQADPNKLGIITGDNALQVFSKTNLPSSTLGEIWALADKDNNGFLTKKDTALALRLIGHAQKGEPVTEELTNKRMSLYSYQKWEFVLKM